MAGVNQGRAEPQARRAEASARRRDEPLWGRAARPGEAAFSDVPGSVHGGPAAWTAGVWEGPPYRRVIDAACLGWPAVRRCGNATPSQGVYRYGDARRWFVEALTSREGRYMTPIRQFCRAPWPHLGAEAVLVDAFILNIRAQALGGAASAMGCEAQLRIVASAYLRLVDWEAAALRDFVVERHRTRGAVPFGAAGGSGGRLAAAEGVNGAAGMLRGRGYGRSPLVCYAPAGSLPPPPPPGASAEGGGIIHVASSAMGGRRGGGACIVFDPVAAFSLRAGTHTLLEYAHPASGRIARLTRTIVAAVNEDAVIPVWCP